MTWDEIRASWSSAWRRLEARAVEVYGAAIRANPDAFREVVVGFMNELAQVRVNLDAIRSKLPASSTSREDVALLEQYHAFERRYHDLAAGLYADAQPVPGTGIAPAVVGVAVAGVLIGVVGIAWAIVAYEYAVNLREQTALGDRELTARIDASRDGRLLQPNTLPEPAPDPIAQAKGAGWVLLGGVVVVLGAAVLPSFLRRS